MPPRAPPSRADFFDDDLPPGLSVRMHCYPVGVDPDDRLPLERWDTYVVRAETLAGLARARSRSLKQHSFSPSKNESTRAAGNGSGLWPGRSPLMTAPCGGEPAVGPNPCRAPRDAAVSTPDADFSRTSAPSGVLRTDGRCRGHISARGSDKASCTRSAIRRRPYFETVIPVPRPSALPLHLPSSRRPYCAGQGPGGPQAAGLMPPRA